MGKFIEWIFTILKVSPNSASWLDLDDSMRFSIKTMNTILIIALIIVVLLPVILISEPVFVSKILDYLFKHKDLPSWPFYFIFIFLIYPIYKFISLFIDIAKMHYKLDHFTFNIIDTVHNKIIQTIISLINCPRETKCRLTNIINDKKLFRQFMSDVFYHFANKDNIGNHNQAEKRRHVFRVWTGYYTTNNFFVILIMSTLLLLFMLFFLKVYLGVLILFAIEIIFIFIYRQMGIKYKQLLPDLAEEQLRAFSRHDNTQFISQIKSVITSCGVSKCPL